MHTHTVPGDNVTGQAPAAFTIVLPCLNEARTLPACLAEAREAISAAPPGSTIIVADNGSTDDSVRVAEHGGARVVEVRERGYGAALATGIRAAATPYVVFADCDGSYDLRVAGRLAAMLDQGSDLVMGSRFPWGGGRIEPGAMRWLHRYIGTPALTLLCRMLYGVRITDINSGMRAVRVSAFNSLNIVSTGMEFSSEITLQMQQRGFRIREVPITLRKDARDRPPHLRTWRDGWRHLCILLLYSPRTLFLVPGALLALFGFVLLAALTPGALMIGDVTLTTNSRIVASLITLMGVQIVTIGMFAKYVAHVYGMIESRQRFLKPFRFFFRYLAIPTGVFLAIAGVSIVIDIFAAWEARGFSQFASARADRFLAPAATLAVIGMQCIVASFFVMLLDLVSRK